MGSLDSCLYRLPVQDGESGGLEGAGVLLKRSSIHELPQPQSQSQSPGEQKEKKTVKKEKKCYTLMTDIRVIQDVMLAISTGNHTPGTQVEAMNIFLAAVDWIQAVVAWHNQHQQTGGLMSSPDVVSLFESLGILLAALSGTAKGLDALSSDSHEGIFFLQLLGRSSLLTELQASRLN